MALKARCQWKHYTAAIEPQLRGGPTAMPDLTLSEFVPIYLERHGADVRPRTIRTLTERLRHAERRFGSTKSASWSG